MSRLGILFATVALAAPAHAQTPTGRQIADIPEQVFRPVIEEYDIPGLAVGVTLDGKQFFFTDGLADRATARAVDEDTLFELGSNSKLFNVALAALAEEKGLLSLDDAVSTRIPALAGGAFDRITLDDLAAHATDGLPLQVPDGIADDAALLRYLTEWQPSEGGLRSYSNVSIGLLGRIAGETFGGTYEEALKAQLLPGLGLDSTFVTVPDDAAGRYAFGYSRTDDSPVRVNPGMLDAEAYGIKSSILDMTRFVDAQLGNLDLDPEIAAALARTQVPGFDTAQFGQAMIWEVYPWPVDPARIEAGNSSDMALKQQPMERRSGPAEGPVFLNKTGATNGFGSYVAMVPSENIGVVVLANRNYPNTVRASATLDLIERVLEAR
ncbi:serine hydrolase [Falsirhodobacter xinxiangensis]|uniref:serine hydrolase n=1 Tax=Falsirhodobacter xinxiangensis TaxID=2530049 RepID=UPI0010AAB623|nr:serine hydrolase [Rhodobacter xinxiangensis]